MTQLTLRNITLTFSGQPLLDQINLQIRAGERIGLLGRNGMGKSTLLKIINQEIQPDSGTVDLKSGTQIGYLLQDVPEVKESNVFDFVAHGLSECGELLIEYHNVSTQLETDYSEKMLARLHRLQEAIEAKGGWQLHQKIETVISRLDLEGEAVFSTLSGGMKRRVLLAQALVNQPNILLLDEPTNHLDIEAIIWLEKFLKNYNGTLLFITHDRLFLQNIATRIIELDRGHLHDYPSDYQKYLITREHELEIEQKNNALFDKRLAQEEKWIRQGIKARRTRNEGRIRALKKMRDARSLRREQVGSAKFTIQGSNGSGKDVIVADKITCTINTTELLRPFSICIERGDKIGILGPNGCGKTTLLRLLLGELEPSTGTVKLGTRLDVAYFDQLRSQLELNKTVEENIGQGRSAITIDGKSKHIIGYCQDFLFSPKQARSSVSQLSGGERNRVLLAKLFSNPSNVLVLDEPTNDLDLETLELLENLLVQYSGTLLLISHDRAFLNNVVTSTIAYIGNASFQEYVGGYDDYLRQTAPQNKSTPQADKTDAVSKVPTKKQASHTLSSHDKRKLSEITKQIEVLEKTLKQLQEKLADHDYFRNHPDEAAATAKQLKTTEAEIEDAYQRWEMLEQGDAS